MWSNEISIDKRHEKEISYILDSIENTNDLSYATEESRDRLYIYVASACERVNDVESRLEEIVKTVILSFFKQEFFLERLDLKKMELAECALLSSIVHFDREFEGAVVSRALAGVGDVNIDGIFNFRLDALYDSWEELAEVSARLVDSVSSDGELYDIASFITGGDGGKNRLLIESGRLKNITCHRTVEVVNLFDEGEKNLLSAILGEKPQEILVERGTLSAPMRSTLRRIARVIER